MIDKFPAFARMVADRFQVLAASDPFVASVDPDALWAAYLAAFPEGTDPVYKKRTILTGTAGRIRCSNCGHWRARLGDRREVELSSQTLDGPVLCFGPGQGEGCEMQRTL